MLRPLLHISCLNQKSSTIQQTHHTNTMCGAQRPTATTPYRGRPTRTRRTMRRTSCNSIRRWCERNRTFSKRIIVTPSIRRLPSSSVPAMMTTTVVAIIRLDRIICRPMAVWEMEGRSLWSTMTSRSRHRKMSARPTKARPAAKCPNPIARHRWLANESCGNEWRGCCCVLAMFLTWTTTFRVIEPRSTRCDESGGLCMETKIMILIIKITSYSRALEICTTNLLFQA